MLEHARVRIFIFEHAQARSMLDFFILDATLLVHNSKQLTVSSPLGLNTAQVTVSVWPWKTDTEW